MRKISYSILLLWSILSVAVGSLGGLVTAPNIASWYTYLIKPDLNPPNWVFGPVWTLLYALMGASAYIVWFTMRKKKPKRNPLYWFGIQFVLNIAWSFIFFGLHSPLWGFVCILFLWGSICKTIEEFRKVRETAAWLLMPYFFWVSFASYLNFSVYILNP